MLISLGEVSDAHKDRVAELVLHVLDEDLAREGCEQQCARLLGTIQKLYVAGGFNVCLTRREVNRSALKLLGKSPAATCAGPIMLSSLRDVVRAQAVVIFVCPIPCAKLVAFTKVKLPFCRSPVVRELMKAFPQTSSSTAFALNRARPRSLSR